MMNVIIDNQCMCPYDCCYYRECETVRLRGRDRSLDQEPDYSFLALTVQTLVDNAVEMTGAQCPCHREALDC